MKLALALIPLAMLAACGSGGDAEPAVAQDSARPAATPAPVGELTPEPTPPVTRAPVAAPAPAPAPAPTPEPIAAPEPAPVAPEPAPAPAYPESTLMCTETRGDPVLPSPPPRLFESKFRWDGERLHQDGQPITQPASMYPQYISCGDRNGGTSCFMEPMTYWNVDPNGFVTEYSSGRSPWSTVCR